jgi:transcriptional regulator with XRE-family HTH domain
VDAVGQRAKVQRAGTATHCHTVASRVRILRHSQGWSPHRLADSAGLSLRTVTGLERADPSVTVDTLRAVADALRITAACLVCDADAEPSPGRPDISPQSSTPWPGCRSQ